jgi:hypothetical protein
MSDGKAIAGGRRRTRLAAAGDAADLHALPGTKR